MVSWIPPETNSPPRKGGARNAGWSVRPRGYAGLTTPSVPSLRLAQPPLLCEEGNMSAKAVPLIVDRLWKVTQWLFLYFCSGANLARFSRRYEIFPITTWFRTATLGGMIRRQSEGDR